METKKFNMTFGGRTLEVEIGRLAKLADASCTVRYGETVVLATACMSSKAREGTDFFPLLVDYRENLYATGKISGSKWVKREGRPSDDATLTARLIDRSLRPLFDQNIRNEIQVVATVISFDKENSAEIPALIASSVALATSSAPWGGPIAGATVGSIDGKMILNPKLDEKEKSEFLVTAVGKKDEIVMIEGGLNEVKEDRVEEALKFAMDEYSKVIDFIKDIAKEINPEKNTSVIPVMSADDEKNAWLEKINKKVDEVYLSINGEKVKETRQNALDSIEKDLVEEIGKTKELEGEDKAFILAHIEKRVGDLFRDSILKEDKRIDGRKLDEVRELTADIGVLPRTHGSGLFSRGETQVLSNVTLGAPGLEQIVETMEVEYKKSYMHHYNFPGYCVGEVKPFRGVGRREIGHGALAEKALVPVIPSQKDFPYTIRVVSDVMGSNGSSSQASICGSTLSLMHAGVPIKRPVAGIAMGLVMDGDNYKILTDIQGIEDHEGDMDFKVAGTTEGTTAIQLDIKLGGISMAIVKDTLVAAKKARLEIIDVITKTIAEPNKELSKYAPRIKTIKIDPEKIGEIIGPGGKIINGIIDETGADINIEEDGKVFVCSESPEGMEKAIAIINGIVKEAVVGEIYEGKVAKILTDRNSGSEIGAIVELWPGGKDGMVHISQFRAERINKVSDIIHEGDSLKVKVMGVDKERGRIELSHKVLLKSVKPEYTNSREDSYAKKPFRKDNSYNKKPNNGPKQHDWPTDNKPAPRPVAPRPVASTPAPTEKTAKKKLGFFKRKEK